VARPSAQHRFLLHAHRLPDRNRLRLPLRRDGIEPAVLDRVTGCFVRGRVDEDAVDRSCRLNTGGGIHHVALRNSFLPSILAQRHERLARGHPHAAVQVEPLVVRVQPCERVADRERGSDRALGVVLVREGCAEDGDDAVAEILVDRSAEALELLLDAGVVGAQHDADVLWVELLGTRGRADDVREHRRHGPPFLLRVPRNRVWHRRAAGKAEPRRPDVLVAALNAERHALSLGRSQGLGHRGRGRSDPAHVPAARD
jgi:hypothetical protein